jgi:hypothetical protein
MLSCYRDAAVRFDPLLLSILLLVPVAPVSAQELTYGQWIWTTSDAQQYERVVTQVRDVVPGILVSTLKLTDHQVTQQIGLWPGTERAPGGVALVVRFDDSLHDIWRSKTVARDVVEIEAKLRWLLQSAAQADVTVREVQLDYDCPNRRLAAWADLLARLRSDVLRKVPLWITSLPTHMQNPRYGILFTGTIAGHILQLFDVGTQLTIADARSLAAQAEGQGLPFRVGLGAFERIQPSSLQQADPVLLTDHSSWFAALPAFATQSHFRGAWVFPAGMPWHGAAADLRVTTKTGAFRAKH